MVSYLSPFVLCCGEQLSFWGTALGGTPDTIAFNHPFPHLYGFCYPIFLERGASPCSLQYSCQYDRDLHVPKSNRRLQSQERWTSIQSPPKLFHQWREQQLSGSSLQLSKHSSSHTVLGQWRLFIVEEILDFTNEVFGSVVRRSHGEATRSIVPKILVCWYRIAAHENSCWWWLIVNNVWIAESCWCT